MRILRHFATAALPIVFLTLAACGSEASVPQQGSPTGGDPSEASSGTVLETMNSGGYTYMRLQTAGGEVWIAAGQMEVQVGDAIEIAGAMPMRDFHSSTLNRTFPEILFVAQAARAGSSDSSPGLGAALPGGHPPLDGMTTGREQPGSAAVDFEGIPDVPGALKIEQVFSRKAELSGETVLIAGKVVKVNPGIMGTNWIHIQDGTRYQEEFDLLVTSSDVPAVGSTIVAEGTVVTDRDLGAGYKFAVMIENATLREP